VFTIVVLVVVVIPFTIFVTSVITNHPRVSINATTTTLYPIVVVTLYPITVIIFIVSCSINTSTQCPSFVREHVIIFYFTIIDWFCHFL
jgi:hypothetical protein